MDTIILKNLLLNKKYINKVLYHLKSIYFETYSDQIIFKIIKKYIIKYSINKLPTPTVIKLILSKSSKLSEEQYSDIIKRVNEIEKIQNEDYDIQWLVDETEDFCKSKSMENAIIQSVDMIQEGNKNLSKISELVRDALKVSFENQLGIDFFNSDHIDKRIEYYNRKVLKIPCKINQLNMAFSGGFEEKSLSLFLGGTHSGKTQTMRSICKDMIENGINCVYITLEMSQEKISQGIEANILNTVINDIPDIPDDIFKNKLLSYYENKGELWIKEWPTRGTSVTYIRNYLEDLWIKKNFKPKVVFVDYLNLLNSDLYDGSQEHLRVKSIAEELRGLAVETCYTFISGTQTNRGGDNASDLSLREIADSFGLTGTADAIIGIISTPELREQKKLIYKIIKNRFGGVIDYKFPVCAENEYSRITDIKNQEMPKLLNTIDSQEKMKILKNKFELKKSKNKLNLSFDNNNQENENEIDILLNSVQ